MDDHSQGFRILAIVLAVCGAGWGLLCGIFIIRGDTIRSLLCFGPGYAVTFGYWWRTLFPPEPKLRRVIWGASALVQGAWLAAPILYFIRDGGRIADFANPFTAWWIFAFTSSVYALIADTNHEPGIRDDSIHS